MEAIYDSYDSNSQRLYFPEGNAIGMFGYTCSL